MATGLFAARQGVSREEWLPYVEPPGFDWRPYLDLSGSRALYPNGRGIAMARHIAFRNLRFIDPGNEVVATLAIAD